MKIIQATKSAPRSWLWWVILAFATPVLLSACGGGGGNDSKPFVPKTTIDAKLFVYGTQVDGAGDLVMYVNGTDSDGNPLTVADLQTASLVVSDGTTPQIYTKDNISLEIEPVAAGDKILSLSFITDYSGSMEDWELTNIANVYKLILSDLPQVYELQIINFSDDPHLRLDWTDSANSAAILAALELDNSFWRNGTALYDTVGFALERDLSVIGTPTTQGDGLIERCRPGRMMVVFSDGKENWSTTYTDRNTLIAMMNESNTVAIMLGTSDADQATLEAFAGESGAIVYVFDTNGIVPEIANWAESLQHMAKFRLAADTLFQGKTVTVALGNQVATAVLPTAALCQIGQ